jgi:hypothetical protein
MGVRSGTLVSTVEGLQRILDTTSLHFRGAVSFRLYSVCLISLLDSHYDGVLTNQVVDCLRPGCIGL